MFSKGNLKIHLLFSAANDSLLVPSFIQSGGGWCAEQPAPWLTRQHWFRLTTACRKTHPFCSYWIKKKWFLRVHYLLVFIRKRKTHVRFSSPETWDIQKKYTLDLQTWSYDQALTCSRESRHLSLLSFNTILAKIKLSGTSEEGGRRTRTKTSFDSHQSQARMNLNVFWLLRF